MLVVVSSKFERVVDACTSRMWYLDLLMRFELSRLVSRGSLLLLHCVLYTVYFMYCTNRIHIHFNNVLHDGMHTVPIFHDAVVTRVVSSEFGCVNRQHANQQK